MLMGILGRIQFQGLFGMDQSLQINKISRNNIQFKRMRQNVLDEICSIQYISPFCYFRGNSKGISRGAMNSFTN